MNIQLPEDTKIMIEAVAEMFGIEPTEENQIDILKMAINYGFSMMFVSGGMVAGFKDHFPQAQYPTVDEPKKEEPKPQVTPVFCNECNKPVIKIPGRDKWACNCSTYDLAPSTSAWASSFPKSN